MSAHRPRGSSAAVLVAIALLLIGCADGGGADDVRSTAPTATTAPGAGTASPSERGTEVAARGDVAQVEREMARAVFELVNEERTERGLDPLEWDEQLAQLARGWSTHMAEVGRLEHQDPEVVLERAEGFSAVGENIFRATGPVPASTVHVGWMRSDQHRVNVLSPDFDRLGVGLVCAEDGLWATQRFGRSGAPGPLAASDDIPPEEPIVAAEGEGPTCPRSP